MAALPDHTQPKPRIDPTEVGREMGAPMVTPEPAAPVRGYTREQVTLRRREELVKWSQFITLLFVALEAMIGLRVLLKLIAANPDSPFAHLVYQFTNIFLAPFNGLTVVPSAQGMVLEIPAIIAMVVYGMLSYFIIRFMWVMFDRANPGAATKYKDDL